jgi:parallel beta-helix repeat protein
MYCEGNADPILLNCLISRNEATSNGGGIYAYGAWNFDITNCSVADNTAEGSGGGAYLDSDVASGTALNSIFWGNSAGAGNQVYTGAIYDLYFINSDYANATGDIEGTGTVGEDSDTIHLDPFFVTGPLGGYYLNSDADAGTDSPCIDGGFGAPADYGLAAKTTRTDGAVDSGDVDMGYHYDP